MSANQLLNLTRSTACWSPSFNPLDPADPGGATLDVAAVRWPFETPMLRYGDAVDVAPFGAGTTS